MSEKWLSVPEYAKLQNKSTAWVYYQIQTGRIKKDKIKMVPRIQERYSIKVED